MTRIKHCWDGLLHAWEVFGRAQRPWEHEGALRWVETVGGSWELHGSTVPDDVAAEQTPLWSRRTGVRW